MTIRGKVRQHKALLCYRRGDCRSEQHACHAYGISRIDTVLWNNARHRVPRGLPPPTGLTRTNSSNVVPASGDDAQFAANPTSGTVQIEIDMGGMPRTTELTIQPWAKLKSPKAPGRRQSSNQQQQQRFHSGNGHTSG